MGTKAGTGSGALRREVGRKLEFWVRREGSQEEARAGSGIKLCFGVEIQAEMLEGIVWALRQHSSFINDSEAAASLQLEP